MAEWWDSEERRWLRRHAIAAPFSIVIVTLLLSYIISPEQWTLRAGLKSAASLVDLGAVIYAMIAVLSERGARLMFWALDERRKWRAEAQAQGRAEGRAEALTALLEVGRTEGNRDLQELIARVAKEEGIFLNGDANE